jgi:hypothetical protein
MRGSGPRHKVHAVVPGHHRIRSGRTARTACAQSQPECLCGALGQVGQGGVPVQSDPLRRALVGAGAEQLCRPFPCRAESPGEGQRPAVPSGDGSALRGASAVPRAIGWASLDSWLRDYCRREGVTSVSTRTVQQFGPIRNRPCGRCCRRPWPQRRGHRQNRPWDQSASRSGRDTQPMPLWPRGKDQAPEARGSRHR